MSRSSQEGPFSRKGINLAEWPGASYFFAGINQELKQSPPDPEELTVAAPDANDEYFIYQTLVGVYVMPGQPGNKATPDVDAPSVDEAAFPDRLTKYLQKTMREAKRNSSYDTPNEAYEEATKAFALRLLDKKRPFWAEFQAFLRRVADFGLINSLAKVVLKCSCPGVPDIYQGCEGWDLSLADPDNRRPVDFTLRQQGLDTLTAPQAETNSADSWANRYDARIKLWLVRTLLAERNQHPQLFVQGPYIPLKVKGRYKKHVLAFARRYQQIWYVIAVSLGMAHLGSQQADAVFGIAWDDTRVMLPPEAIYGIPGSPFPDPQA